MRGRGGRAVGRAQRDAEPELLAVQDFGEAGGVRRSAEAHDGKGAAEQRVGRVGDRDVVGVDERGRIDGGINGRTACTVRMSYPASSKCVATAWRNVWVVASFVTPAARAAATTLRFTALGCAWCRQLTPVRGSVDGLAEGNTHCQPQSVPVFGYFRALASGKNKPCIPFARSASGSGRTRPRWSRNRSAADRGRIVRWSFPPLP